MGMRASTTLIPVWSGAVTGSRAMTGGASRSTGRRLTARTSPWLSSGRPVASTTRPIRPSPTGTSRMRSVRLTSEPATMCSLGPSRMIPISSGSMLKTSPCTFLGNSTTSSDLMLGRPPTRTMPCPTYLTSPTSRSRSSGCCPSRTRSIVLKVSSRNSFSSSFSLGMLMSSPCYRFSCASS